VAGVTAYVCKRRIGMKITKKKGLYSVEFETKTDKEYFYNLLNLARKMDDAVGSVSVASIVKFRDTKVKKTTKKR
jgi:hypothetical protein